VLKVTVDSKGMLKDLERRYGMAGMRKHAQNAMAAAAKQTIVPAVKQETPTGNKSSPWRRSNSYEPTQSRYPGPMRDRVYVKRLRRHGTEAGAIMVGIKHYALTAVVRGTKEHIEPNHPYYKSKTHPHPGATGKDIFGPALSRSEAAFVKAVETYLRNIP